MNFEVAIYERKNGKQIDYFDNVESFDGDNENIRLYFDGLEFCYACFDLNHYRVVIQVYDGSDDNLM